MPTASASPGKSLLSPAEHTLVLIDFPSQMVFATKSIDPELLRNNAALICDAARAFGVDVTSGLPARQCTTHADVINPDLLAVVKD